MNNIQNNYAALPKDFSDYNKSKVVIIPVPYEGTVTYGKGTSKGPGAIIEASKNMELYDIELNKEICEIGIHTLKGLKCEKEPQKVIEQIYNEAKKLINDKKFIVMLGGEHSITTGLVKAYKESFDSLSVLQIDAHSDLRQSYNETIYSHACIMKRIFDMKIPFIQVGIRSQDIEEVELVKKNNLKLFYSKDIYDNNDWMMDVISRLTNNVYITIDIDALDPSIMPSTGTPEPGGLQWYQILRFLRKVAKQKNIIGFDVVELAPQKNNPAPDFLVAKLVYKLIGYIFC
jgi:agmatinase